MNNPLYNRVKKIAVSNTASGQIRHSSFECIRNQASVRAILKDMGYKPCNEAKPCVWRKPSVRSNAKVKPVREMKTSAGQKVLDELKEKGVYQVSSFELSRKYLEGIIADIRELGYSVQGIRTDRFITSYVLNEQ